MVRVSSRGVLALALFVGASAGVGLAQPPAGADRIVYVPKRGAAVKEESGDLKLDPTGARIFSGGKQIAAVTAADIVLTVPLDLKELPPEVAAEALKHERARDWDKARAVYEGLRDKLKGAGPQPDRLKKWLAFRLAFTTARAADDVKADGGWKERAEAGAKLLTEYTVDNPGGWEVWAATRTAARINHELGKSDEAARLWGKLAKSADLGQDLKTEAAFQEADALARAGRIEEAGAKAADALAKAAPGPAKDRLNLFAVAGKSAGNVDEAVKTIEELIGKTRDPSVRAAGFALTGELYLKAGRPREAMWAILWVEVVYNQDKDEVAKALARLTTVFGQLGDEDRAAAYQDRMRRNRALLL